MSTKKKTPAPKTISQQDALKIVSKDACFDLTVIQRRLKNFSRHSEPDYLEKMDSVNEYIDKAIEELIYVVNGDDYELTDEEFDD